MEAIINTEIPNKANITIVITVGIHNGAVIHHHDQVRCPKTLRIKNTMNRKPINPIPVELICIWFITS